MTKMGDPTYREMKDLLGKSVHLYEYDTFDIEEAIYWFANDWHDGQLSNLYSALSTSKFKPGPIARSPQSTMSQIAYDELQHEFKVK